MASTPADCVRFGVLALDKKFDLILSGVNKKVYSAIERTGIVDKLGKENVLNNIDQALARAEELAKQINN